jgi:F0F1-type ATP synthase alpha subunit
VIEHQLVLIYAAISGYLDSVEVKQIAKFKDVLFELIWDEEANVLSVLKELAGADLNVKSVIYDIIIQTALRATL